MTTRANTISRGGGGVHFEHRVGADMLNRLLTRSGLPALDDAFEVTEVAFQTGDPVDDLRVRASHPGLGLRTLFVAARRKPGLRPSDKKFVALVASMLDQVDADPDAFAARESRLGLAVRADTPAVESMVELCVVARNHDSGAGLQAAVCSPGAHSQPVRTRYSQLLDVVALARRGGSPVQLQDWLWGLLYACHLLPLRLEVDNSLDRTAAIERLGLVGLETGDATETHAAMETLASDYGKQGAVVDMVRLRRDLQPLARVGRSTRSSVGWQLTDRLDAAAAMTVPRLVRSNGTVLSIERADLRRELRQAIAACGAAARLLVVTGEPSTGKSALAIAAAGDLAREGEAILRMNLRDLPGGVVGVDAGLAAILSTLIEAPVAPCRAILIDGCEAITEGRSRTLQLLVSAALEAGLGVALVVREDLLTDVVDLVAIPDFDQLGVGLLSDDEIDHMASEIPALVPATRNERSRRIVGRIGLVSLLVQSLGTDQSDAALSEAMVMRQVWGGVVRRRDNARTGSSPDDRAAATEAVAHALLGLPAGQMPPGAALEHLRLDGVLARAPSNTPWVDDLRFADDAIRDLAVAFVLLKENLTPLEDAAPKWALRAARIAVQARLEEAADAAMELDTLQTLFDKIARTSGVRWSEIPTEALITARAPEATLRACATWIVDDQRRIQRLLRVLRQRHGGPFDTLDPVVATPVLALLANAAGSLPTRGDLATDSTKVLLAWLRGLAHRGIDGPCEVRRRYMKLLVAKDHHDDKMLEAIAMLGTDLGQGAEFLRSIANSHPWRLHSVMESSVGPYSLAKNHPELLIELTEAYYIEEPDQDRGYSGLIANGIRDQRHGTSFGHPFAAAWYGPFWQILNSKPVEALAAIERILLHTLRVTAAPEEPPALGVNLPGLGDRQFTGDLTAWGWYRGLPMGIGPHPCMSALMAVERFADHLVSLGVPPADVVTVLLRTAETVPTLGLAVGFAVRHASGCDEFVVAFLREPAIWDAEIARAAGEIMGLKAGPRDDDEVVNSERRKWDFRELGSRLMASAIASADRARIEQLREVSESNIAKAKALGTPEEEHARLWTTVLIADNYTRVQFGDQEALSYEPPSWAADHLAEQLRSMERANQVLELRARYDKDDYGTSTLAADIRIARGIATDPPDAHRPGDAVALVALAAVRAHADSTTPVKRRDLRWAFNILRASANSAYDDDEFYPPGGDRSAAAAIGLLLTPGFIDSSPKKAIVGLKQVAAFGATLAANGSDQVRRLLGIGLRPVWAAPCGPGDPGSDDCRHQVALMLAEQSAQRCRLGPFDGHSGQRRMVDVPLPLATELDLVPTSDVMLTRLTGPIVATIECSLSGCCVSECAMPLAQAMVRTYQRAAGHWADSDFQYREWDSEPAAAALLSLSAHGDDALIDTALHLADHPHGLATLLDDICRLATYDRVHRSQMSALWPELFERVTFKLRATSQREGDAYDHWSFWGEYALAALVPVQQFNLDEMEYDATLAASKDGWPGLDALAGSINTWLELAAGIPKCVDALARLVRQESDVTTGLGWIERLIDGHTSWIANRTGGLHHWFKELAGTQLTGEGAASLDRIVDALASAGDDHLSRLQHD